MFYFLFTIYVFALFSWIFFFTFLLRRSSFVYDRIFYIFIFLSFLKDGLFSIFYLNDCSRSVFVNEVIGTPCKCNIDGYFLWLSDFFLIEIYTKVALFAIFIFLLLLYLFWKNNRLSVFLATITTYVAFLFFFQILHMFIFGLLDEIMIIPWDLFDIYNCEIGFPTIT